MGKFSGLCIMKCTVYQRLNFVMGREGQLVAFTGSPYAVKVLGWAFTSSAYALNTLKCWGEWCLIEGSAWRLLVCCIFQNAQLNGITSLVGLCLDIYVFMGIGVKKQRLHVQNSSTCSNFAFCFFLVFSVGFDLLLLEVCDSRSEGGSKLPFIGCNLILGFF